MIDWQKVPLWTLHSYEPGLYCIRVCSTVDAINIGKVIKDGNIKIELYNTLSDRLVGYAFYYKEIQKKEEHLPRIISGALNAYLFFRPSNYVVKERGEMLVVYKDTNIRVFKYRIGRYVDFMLVMRLTSSKMESNNVR